MAPGASSGETKGRYVVHAEIAAGGMATVHLGRLVGAAGFARTVAIKRLHPRLAKDPEFVAGFVDEARLAACIRHPNVASTLDVVVSDDEILVVMEYVHGESLSRLVKGERAPLPIVGAIVSQMLTGLHAAHEAVGPYGEPLKLVHRDVSPQNVVVGADGIVRLIDFGVAKASWRTQDTRDGSLKGKIAYMSPEQLQWRPLDRRADVYAASVVLWEALTGVRLFVGKSTDETVDRILAGQVAPPSSMGSVPSALDAVVLRGLASSPSARYETALEMAMALETAIPLASARELGAWVGGRAAEALAKRAAMVRELELSTWKGDASDRTDLPGFRAASPDADQEKTDSALSGPATPAPGGYRRAWALAGAFVLLSTVAVALLRRSEVPAQTSAPPAVASSVTPDPSPAGSLDSESKPAASTPSLAVSVEVSPPSPSARPRSTRPGGSPKAGPPRAPKANCNPPYIVGADGIRRFRPECI